MIKFLTGVALGLLIGAATSNIRPAPIESIVLIALGFIIGSVALILKED